MRSGWKIAKLGNLASYVNGYPFKPTDWEEEGLPIIRIQNLNSARDEYHYFKGTILPRYKVCKGDILISWSASLGVYTWDGPDALLNQHIFKVVFDKEQINKEFFVYAVSYKLDEMKKLVHGATMQHITRGKFDGIDIPVPSLPEQQRIVGVLDQEFAKIDALKANVEKSFQAAKDLFQATLKKELEPKEGWELYSLKDVCTEYGDYGMSSPSRPFDGIRYLRITDITEWGDLNDDRVSVDAEEIEDRYMVRNGDILFARTGATVGKTLVYEDRLGSCCYAGYLIRYRPDQSIVLPRMLYYITHSASYYEWVAISQKSATLPNISAKLYNAYELTLPSIKEQEQIIARLDNLNGKCKALQLDYQKTLALCDDLKQALLRKAFNGEL